MDFKHTNNKAITEVPLTKEEAEVVVKYLLDRIVKLEDYQLKDSYCYPKLLSAYYKIKKDL